jgi:type IV pilus assembly protein PilC
MDARDSMRMALRSTHNPAYTLQQEVSDGVLAAGGEFHEAVKATGVFPQELFEAMLTADHTGTHTETLLHMSRVYEDRSKDNARTLAFVASGGVWLVVASFLIFMIFRLAMFYLGSLNSALDMTR